MDKKKNKGHLNKKWKPLTLGRGGCHLRKNINETDLLKQINEASNTKKV